MGARILGRFPALAAAAVVAGLVVPASAGAVVSLTYNAAGDTITVEAGDGETNALYVQEVIMGGGNVFFQESTPGVNLSAPGCFQPGTYAAECDGTGVTTIIVKMGDKRDTLDVPDVSWPVDRGIEVTGGPGIDIVNGSPGRDTLNGGGGQDQLKGDGGLDAMFGGGGKDQLNARDGEADRKIDCGKGSDLRAKRDADLDPPAKSC
jgi:Ca2+-binding RTX toxin-like protein